MLQNVVACFVLLSGAHAEDPTHCGGGHQQCSLGNHAMLQARSSSMLQAKFATTKVAHAQTGMTCAAEEKIRRVVEHIIWTKQNLNMPLDKGHDIPQHTKYKTLAAVIREVFHDAQDHNNLMLNSTLTGVVSPVDSATFGEYGGVDGCLYVPLPDLRLGSWIHKKEMNYPMDFVTLYQDRDALIARTAGKFAIAACEALCCINGFLTRDEKHALCGPELSICKPKIRHPLPGVWHVQQQEGKYIHSMTNLLKDKCLVDMHVFGALLITEKVGGPKIPMTWGRRQADCTKLFAGPKKPGCALKPFPIWLNAAPYGSFQSLHHLVEDFERMGFSERDMTALMGAHSFGKIHKYAGDFAPREWTTGFCNSKRDTWAVGGFWDKTPDKLDNEYFKQLNTINPAEKEICCGPMVKGKGCWTQNTAPMQFWNGSLVPGQGCKSKWCMRSAVHFAPRNKHEGNWAMLSTQETIPAYNEKKYGKSPPARLYALAADWALLENSQTRAAVKEFAESESAFHSAFHQALDKATSFGYPSGSIKTCSGLRPPAALELKNAHQPCWKECGGKAGFCDWCGSAGACCKRGEYFPEECKWSTNLNVALGGHHCVKTLMDKKAA